MRRGNREELSTHLSQWDPLRRTHRSLRTDLILDIINTTRPEFPILPTATAQLRIPPTRIGFPTAPLAQTGVVPPVDRICHGQAEEGAAADVEDVVAVVFEAGDRHEGGGEEGDEREEDAGEVGFVRVEGVELAGYEAVFSTSDIWLSVNRRGKVCL